MRRLSKLLSVYTTCLQCCSFKKGLSFRYHMRLSFEKCVPVDPAQPTDAQRVICSTSHGSISPICKVFLLQRKGTVFAGRPGVRCGKKEKVTSCLISSLVRYIKHTLGKLLLYTCHVTWRLFTLLMQSVVFCNTGLWGHSRNMAIFLSLHTWRRAFSSCFLPGFCPCASWGAYIDLAIETRLVSFLYLFYSSHGVVMSSTDTVITPLFPLMNCK